MKRTKRPCASVFESMLARPLLALLKVYGGEGTDPEGLLAGVAGAHRALDRRGGGHPHLRLPVRGHTLPG